MEVERVQKWVMSTLMMTTAIIFSGGLAALAGGVANRGGARPGLLVIGGVVGVMGVIGVRVINQKPVVTPWLAMGLVPAAVGCYLLYLT